jgi:hypothetical protein
VWDPALPENEPHLPPDHVLSPAARQLLVEAFERRPGMLVTCRVATIHSPLHRTASEGCADAEDALASLVHQGLFALEGCTGTMVRDGYTIRMAWSLTKAGVEVARIEAAS